jgi:hypothetical protein
VPLYEIMGAALNVGVIHKVDGLQPICTRLSAKLDTYMAGTKLAAYLFRHSYFSYANRVTNRADAHRMLGIWAELLRHRLDEFHDE